MLAYRSSSGRVIHTHTRSLARRESHHIRPQTQPAASSQQLAASHGQAANTILTVRIHPAAVSSQDSDPEGPLETCSTVLARSTNSHQTEIALVTYPIKVTETANANHTQLILACLEHHGTIQSAPSLSGVVSVTLDVSPHTLFGGLAILTGAQAHTGIGVRET